MPLARSHTRYSFWSSVSRMDTRVAPVACFGLTQFLHVPVEDLQASGLDANLVLQLIVEGIEFLPRHHQSVDGSYTGQQLGKIERFAKIVLSAGVEADDQILRLGQAGQHDHGDMSCPGIGLEFACSRDPVHGGHGDIHDDNVGHHFDGHFEALPAVQRLQHIKTCSAQVRGEEGTELGLIVNHQDATAAAAYHGHQAFQSCSPCWRVVPANKAYVLDCIGRFRPVQNLRTKHFEVSSESGQGMRVVEE
jgi:hypothetical protein